MVWFMVRRGFFCCRMIMFKYQNHMEPQQFKTRSPTLSRNVVNNPGENCLDFIYTGV